MFQEVSCQFTYILVEEILPDNEEILNPPFQSHSMKVLLPCNLNPMTFQWITTSVDNLLSISRVQELQFNPRGVPLHVAGTLFYFILFFFQFFSSAEREKEKRSLFSSFPTPTPLHSRSINPPRYILYQIQFWSKGVGELWVIWFK